MLQDLGKANTPSAIGLLKDEWFKFSSLGIGDIDYSKVLQKL